MEIGGYKKNIHPLTKKTMGEELRKLKKNERYGKEDNKVDRGRIKRGC